MGIYDILGREVASLMTGHYNAGRYSVTWDAGSYGSGVYFARLMFNGDNNKVNTKNIKVLLTK